MNENLKYIHDEYHHNLESPQEIVPYLIKLLEPKSVVDVGCGIGTFLKVFTDNGIRDVYGLDGPWVNRSLLSKYLDSDKFEEVDLEKQFNLNRRFDLALSLEVAEHLKEESADIFVLNLVNLSDRIVFSAAFPNQGGQNHINEQWPSYWKQKFEKYDYLFLDILRSKFWNNDKVQIWYKQNMFLIIKSDLKDKYITSFNVDNQTPLDIVHPNIVKKNFEQISALRTIEHKYDNLLKGKEKLITYLKINAKWLLRKIGLYKK
jgi:SAM-dependent methyltransferase